MENYVIGLDFGTLSVRALLVDVQTGSETAVETAEYEHGVMDGHLPDGTRLPAGFALQDPRDYLKSMSEAVRRVIQTAGIDPGKISGIGAAFTSSTILPVTADGTPLCCIGEFLHDPHAWVKLWKHHGAQRQADRMQALAAERNEPWLPLYGGRISCEWMFPKMLETLQEAPQVYEAAKWYLEALEWITWKLTGTLTRSACTLGYKAFCQEGTFPSPDYFGGLDERFRTVVYDKIGYPGTVKMLRPGEDAGHLCPEMAKELGLSEKTAVSAGIVDAHSSIPGNSITAPGTMMLIAGTSSCHMILSEKKVEVPGIAGIVRDGSIPGYYTCEAGQSCVGDHFDWFVRSGIPSEYERQARGSGISVYELLEHKLAGYQAGQSGLLALDWFNGVRTPLMDADLTGCIFGLTLHTKPEEIYLSLIEATAYGTRMILELFEEAGVRINEIIMGGGIAGKNRLLVQVYADVCSRPIRLSGTDYDSARGAAVLAAGAVSGLPCEAGIREAAGRLGAVPGSTVCPRADSVPVYDQLYQEYKEMHRLMGTENPVLKHLLQIRSCISERE